MYIMSSKKEEQNSVHGLYLDHRENFNCAMQYQQ